MTDTVADATDLDAADRDRAAVPAPPPADVPARAPGLGPAFRRSWLADLASGAGEGLRIGALPLLAAALDYSPGAVAAVWVAGGLPFILVGPFSGVLSDRWRRYRRTMWVSDVLAAVAAALLAAAVLTHVAGIWTLLAFNLAVGSLATLRDNAATAIVPELVPAALLDRANSRVQTVQFLTIDLVGPPLGALLFTVARGAPFALDALSFVVAALLVFGLPRTPAPVRAPDAGDAGGTAAGVLAQMREGAGWLRRHRLLRSVCLIVGLQSLAVMSAVSVAVLYAYEVLGVGQRVYIALMAVIALGAVGGSLLAPVLSARLGRTAALRVALAFAPVAFAVAAVTSTPAVAATALAFVGAAVGVGNVVSVSLRHALVPEDLRGRVNSSYRLVAVGMGPVGAALGGLSSEAFGLRAPMAVSAVASGTALVVALRSTRRPETGPGTSPETDAGADVVVPRRRRSRLRRVLVGLLALVVLLPLLGAGYLGWTVRRSFPQVDGQLAVAGLQARVDVVRDRYGVPQISAGTSHDLFLAQGYVQAQDRFWQMDVARHVTAGRLAELFGADQVETDSVVRTLGWRHVAEAELQLLSPQTRAQLDAFADGVNAYLATRQGAELSVEHAVLGVVAPGYRPEPWTALDSVSWLKAMAWTLRGNDSEETQRALLSSALPADRVDQLFPGYDFSTQRPIVAGTGTPAGTSTGTPARAAAPAPAPALSPAPSATVTAAGLSRVTAVLESTLGPSGPGIGSNSWVVSGSRTTTGRPLLANDPHLGPSLPSIWYQVGLHCRTVGPACPYDVAGVGFAPMPGVYIGHNADISWGLTNFGADVADLYLEQVTGDRYLYQGAMVPLSTRQEVIRVAGGKPVTITVSSTRHGPIISGVDKQARAVGVAMAGRDGAPAGGGPLAVALRWTALDPSTTLDSVFALDRASDWTTFREAMRGFASPAQNVVYADRAGHIGYQAIGVVPVRSAGDGRYPVAGWTGTHEWVGTIPYDAMPRTFDPPSGYVVTANNAAVGPGYPYLITSDWPDGYRSERIAKLIETGGKLDAAAMRRIQQDTLNPMAATLVPYLLRVAPTAGDRRAVELLHTWDGTQPVDSAGAAYFNAVWRSLLRLAFTDDLRRTPADPDPSGGGRWLEVVRSLLTRPSDPWWANATDPRHLTTRDDVLRAALDDAATELTTRLGPDPAHWRWGDLHRLTLKNETLGQGPAPLQWLLNRGPYELAGGNSAVDATGWDARDGYAVDWIPSMRMVVDVGAWDASGWVNAAGASGHAGTGTYTDQTDDWVAGRTTAWPFSASAVQAAQVHALTLVP